MHVAIETKNLTVKFEKKFVALKDVNITLPAGKIIGFIGPSGAGKTTLIRCLVGRQKITHGSAKVLGVQAGSAKLRGRFSYMTQSLSVYPDLTVRENFSYFASMLGQKGAAKVAMIAVVLEQVDMTPQADRLVSGLSGGQKQRVSLGVSLLGDPEILFLDEPTVGLDPVLREQLWDLFRELVTAGKTIVLSSHVMDEADRCDDLLLIRDGKVLAHASPKRLRAQTRTKSVEESFIELVGEQHESA